MNVSFKTALLCLISAFQSGYAIKFCKSSQIISCIVWLSLAIQIFGFIVNSSPMASIRMKKLHQFSLDLLIKSLYLPLFIAGYLLKNNRLNETFVAVYVTISALILIWHITKSIRQNVVNFIVCCQCLLLLCLAVRYDPENYWLLHLIALYLLNHFLLPKIARRYTIIPLIDLLTVELLFLNIFLINSMF
jgi:hypothetical protein